MLYIGMTSNLAKRMEEHRAGAFKGFSAKYNCNRLVWFESFAEPIAAISREKELKGWTRAKKIALIEKQNRTWVDLSIAGNYRVSVHPNLSDKSTAGPALRSG